MRHSLAATSRHYRFRMQCSARVMWISGHLSDAEEGSRNASRDGDGGFPHHCCLCTRVHRGDPGVAEGSIVQRLLAVPVRCADFGARGQGVAR